MKSLLIAAVLTFALAACVSAAPNTPPSQVTSSGSFGGIKVKSSGLPVTSGNANGIQAGAAGQD